MSGARPEEDERFMRRCLVLAGKGRGAVSPNPLVGSVVVKDGVIIGEGYHRRYGGPHAEVNAIRDAERRGASVEGAELYVSLEPCFHYGNTPPCVDLVIEKKLKRVAAAVNDPNPLVNGKSIRKLQEAGIETVTGILQSEALRMNAPFFTYIRKARPFVALKTAQTADGFIAHADGSSKWITNERSRKHVHALRASFDAVLVGAGTVTADNPMLTVRAVKGRNPLRIVLDGSLSIPESSLIVTTCDEASTLIYTATARTPEKKEKIRRLEARGAVVVQMHAGRSRRIPIGGLLADLANHTITSVLVEGGACIYREFLEAGAADVLYQYRSQQMFGEGIPGVDRLGVSFARTLHTQQRFGKDTLDEYDLTYPRLPDTRGRRGSRGTGKRSGDGAR
ncbi:MAG: bifunctional diaminohydroxyphosphoribosylaminopyrimidine deaminase/5-amino-6-(5-phosphoribosylamino)uracil reductase RibD [Acidobacteriota bacterium]